MQFRAILAATVMSIAAFAVTGCTTTTDAADPALTSFAPMPDLSSAPVPASKPDSPEGMASLAADVEGANDTALATPASFAPQDAGNSTTDIAKQTIPDEAIEFAMAKPVTDAPIKASARDRDCLMRAMYFESNRSSRDGQLAVGTVVMHRVSAGNWGKSVCGVVGAKRQFAPGVMSRHMQGDTSDLAALADAILQGKRHPKLAKNVMFFHVAGMKFPYKNMHYVHVAGGNTFYFKASRRRG